MPLNVKECREVLEEFLSSYSVINDLNFKIRDTEQEFGYSQILNFKAAYTSYSKPNEENLVGRIDIVASNHKDKDDLTKSLNHEILGHYGLNTFTPQEKKSVLNSLIFNRESLQSLWDYVDENYPNAPLYHKAEEVYSLMAERILPEHHIDNPKVKELGEVVFKQTSLFYTKKMTEQELNNIVLMVAEGISDGTRYQRTFPADDLTLRVQPEMDRDEPTLEMQ